MKYSKIAYFDILLYDLMLSDILVSFLYISKGEFIHCKVYFILAVKTWTTAGTSQRAAYAARKAAHDLSRTPSEDPTTGTTLIAANA